MCNARMLLESEDSDFLLAMQAVTRAVGERRLELDERLAHLIIAKLGDAMG